MKNPCQQEPGHNAFRNQLPTATTAAGGATAVNAASDDWLMQICRENETLCKQLKDFHIECKELAGIKAQLAEAQADKKAAKVNKDLKAELADFSSNIGGILAAHNERDRSSTIIVMSLKRMLSKANQQLHSNDMCNRGMRNHNIIAQRLDERTHALVDWATRELKYRGTMQRSKHTEA
ncbi:hypothetical protein GGF37_001381 [Kickxella alabastrina]|nr:hypothetical protein GGF37_001381 [Kickxella alabastrina]